MAFLQNLCNLELYEFQQDLTIGRDPSCDLQIEHDQLSRKHLALKFKQSLFWAEDLNSTNGSAVNYQNLRQARPLNEGDVISLGPLNFVFKQNEQLADEFCAYSFPGDLFDSYLVQGSNDGSTALKLKFPHPPGWNLADIKNFSSTQTQLKLQRAANKASNFKPEAGQALAALLRISDQALPAEYILSGEKAWPLGRSASCPIAIPHDTLELEHAILSFENKRWKLKNLATKNKSSVNRREVSEIEVRDQDVLRFGDVLFAFKVLDGAL